MSHKEDMLWAAVEDAIRHAIRLPNKQFAYSRCNICDASWWDTEEHRLGCAVPRWKLALASRLRAAADCVCVPREPTEEMCTEGTTAYYVAKKAGEHITSAVYRAMLAAAPGGESPAQGATPANLERKP